jgi:hypothetical protein
MLLWFFSFALALYSFQLLFRIFAPSLRALWGAQAEARRWHQAALEIRSLESRLESGQGWDVGGGGKEGWEQGAPVFVQRAMDAARDIRERGAQVLPYLGRVRAECVRAASLLARASEESAGARAQAGACLILFPLFSAGLTLLLPDLRQSALSWGAFCAVALILGAIGYFWMLRMSALAQWGGLPAHRRAWIFFPAQIATALVSEIQSGVPGDLAWSQVYRKIVQEDQEFATRMGSSLWSTQTVTRSRLGLLEIIDRGIEDQRRIVAHAVLEGRAAVESLERLLDQVQEEIRAELSRGVRQLSTRALAPLFLCVAPGFFILIVGAIWLGGLTH